MSATAFGSASFLAERYNVSESCIWRWVQKRILPPPLRISPGCSRFDVAAADRCIAERGAVDGPSDRTLKAAEASLASPKRKRRAAA